MSCMDTSGPYYGLDTGGLHYGRNGDDDLSVFSCGSLEGTGGDVVRKSEADLLHEVTDLQFRNRRLQEEIAQLKRQLVQAEDANVAVQNSYVELQKRANMLQSNLDRCKFLETEYSALRQSLSTTEEQLTDANDKKKCLEKDIRLLTIEIHQAENRIKEVESELAAAQNENEDLTSFLMREQSEVSRMKQQLEDMEAALNYEREQKNEARQSLEEITRILQIVQAEKNDLEAQLSRLLEEHPSLRAAVSNTSFYLESEMALRRFMPTTSTPFRWNDCNETLHEELKRLGVDCDSEGPWSLPIFSREEEDDPPPMPDFSQDDTSSSELKKNFDLLASTNSSALQPPDTTSELLRKEMLATEPKVFGDTFTISDPVVVQTSQNFDLLEPSFSPPELNKTVSLPSRKPPAAPRPVKWKSADNLLEEKKSGLLKKTAKLKKLREKQEKLMNAEKEKMEMIKPIFKLQSSSENLLGMTMSTDRLLVKSKHVSSQTHPPLLPPSGLLLPDIIHSSQKDLVEFSAIEKPKPDWSKNSSGHCDWSVEKDLRSDWSAPVCDTKRWPIRFLVAFVIMLCALCCVVQISMSGRNKEKCFQPVFIWYPVWEIIDSHLTFTYSGLPPQ